MKRLVLLAAALVTLGRADAATVLFEDNFETDTSASWDVLNGSNSGTPDFTADWAFDYSSTQYTSNGVAYNIPPAPSSSGTSKGVKLTANKLDDVAEAAAVNLYPKGKTFSGNYALRFDMWINHIGGEYGGNLNSTEFAIFGINHTGTQANWAPPAAAVGAVPSSDGLWFGVTGEGGAARDYRYYEGDPAGAPLEYSGADGGFLDRDSDGSVEQEVVSTTAADYPLDIIYSRPPQETRGAPGKKWVQVEVRQQNGVVTWIMDGYVISEQANDSLWTEGNVMIGTMDNFNSLANPREGNFVIFDNLRVVDLGNDPAPARLTLEATQNAASEPSTSGTFTITRSGNTATALNVRLGLRGSATVGQDFATIPLMTNIAAGATTLSLPVTVVDDQRAEPVEQVKLHLIANSAEYEVFAPIIGTVEIADDNDLTAVSVSAADPFAFEGIPSDIGRFRISRVGDVSTDLTVNYAVDGTAAASRFQSLGTSVVLPAGAEFADVTVVPINQSGTEGDQTVTLELSTGEGYSLGTATNATITIREDDGIEPGTVVFSDNFDTDTSAQWRVNEAHVDNNRATFNFDYSTVGIPVAPNTTGATTRGLKLEANVGAPTFTGLSVSPVGEGFEGDYRLSFDMWINYNGPLAAGGTGSTMSFSAGVGTSGEVAQFPGSSVEGVMFSVTGDGGSGSDWRAYTATGAPLANTSGVYAAGTGSTALNNTDPYYAPFGRAEAPEAQLAIFPDQTEAVSPGAPGMAWHEVSIEKRGSNISWFVDNLRIATVPLGDKEISTNIFVGFFDINTTQTGNQDLSFGLVDNLRVETLEPSTPTGEVRITSIQRDGQNLEIQFTADVSLSSFVVEGSATVNGNYTAEPNAQISGSGTTRTAMVPITSDDRFFRVRAQ